MTRTSMVIHHFRIRCLAMTTELLLGDGPDCFSGGRESDGLIVFIKPAVEIPKVNSFCLYMKSWRMILSIRFHERFFFFLLTGVQPIFF